MKQMNKHFKQGWTLCDLEVNTDPEDNDPWVRITIFGPRGGSAAAGREKDGAVSFSPPLTS